MIDLRGKSVLYVAPKFFGYDQDILEELERRGAAIDFLYDRPFDSPAMVALTRFARPAVMPAVDRHYLAELKRFGRTSYDLVFVVNGQTLSSEFLKTLKTNYATAQFVLYMWDSMANRPSAVRNTSFFDRVLTFDRRDAAAYDMTFRPLFYSRGFDTPPGGVFQYDISFIGTAHSDRAKIVSDIDRFLPADARRFWYLYLQARWVFAAYKLTNPTFRSTKISQVSFQPMAKKTVQAVMAGSRAILDIEHPRQIGLTMRTFETLGASKKLVTTNREVESYDFFDAANICVVSREDAVIAKGFLEADYQPLAASLRHKYSLAGWVDEILETG